MSDFVVFYPKKLAGGPGSRGARKNRALSREIKHLRALPVSVHTPYVSMSFKGAVVICQAAVREGASRARRFSVALWEPVRKPCRHQIPCRHMPVVGRCLTRRQNAVQREQALEYKGLHALSQPYLQEYDDDVMPQSSHPARTSRCCISSQQARLKIPSHNKTARKAGVI